MEAAAAAEKAPAAHAEQAVVLVAVADRPRDFAVAGWRDECLPVQWHRDFHQPAFRQLRFQH